MSRNGTYTLMKLDSDSYQFTSDAGNLYHIYFKLNYQNDVVQLYTDNRDIEIYEFFFEIISIQKIHVNDTKITDTILSILEDFLIKSSSRVVFYITSRDDGRNRALSKIYDVWYRVYIKRTNTRMKKVNRIIMLGNYIEAYLSCLYLDTQFDESYVNSCLTPVLAEIYPNYNICTDTV